jgi:hypothetical protein
MVMGGDKWGNHRPINGCFFGIISVKSLWFSKIFLARIDDNCGHYMLLFDYMILRLYVYGVKKTTKPWFRRVCHVVRDWKVRLTTQIMLQTHPQKVLGSIGIWNDLWKLIMFRCNLWIHNLCIYHIYTHIWYVPCTLIDISPGYEMITFWLCMIFWNCTWWSMRFYYV